MKYKTLGIDTKLWSSYLVQNSFWGLTATVFQSVFLTLFFIVLAREYSTEQFANFLIASAVYQIIVSFSSMGLGQWFIREYKQQSHKVVFLNKFLKIQLCLGLTFYFVSLGAAFSLYPPGEIRLLILILGTNIIFDNLIYSFRNLNIAESNQVKSARILFFDGLYKLLLSCVVFIYPISIVQLSILLVLTRLVTINSFFRQATGQINSVVSVIKCKVSVDDFKKQLIANWYFVVIGSVSIIYWRVSNILISKILEPEDVVNFEIAFKILTVFLLVPTAVSTSLFPLFIKFFHGEEFQRARAYYQNTFSAYLVFSLLSFAFIYSFSEDIVTLAFGERYSTSAESVKLMFLSIVVFPTIFLQANIIIAMKREKSDMYFNMIALSIHLLISLVGLHFYKSLEVIYYSIFASFFIFHLLQDALLIRKGFTTVGKTILVYSILILFLFLYQYLVEEYNPYVIFLTVGTGLIATFAVMAARFLFYEKSI